MRDKATHINSETRPVVCQSVLMARKNNDFRQSDLLCLSSEIKHLKVYQKAQMESVEKRYLCYSTGVNVESKAKGSHLEKQC